MGTLMRGARPNILAAVGNTPLVKLNRLGQHTQAEIYVKCEFMNPGGSMKDRIAISIMDEAERSGALVPGGTVVEATSGNTGMGLALVAAVRGYRAIFVMPDKMSNEKICALRAVGAKVVICPTDVEPKDPRSYYCVSRRIADETPNAFYANQYHNPANPEAHYRGTGPELWAQTGGEFDVFCAGMGTGGTLSGTGKFLKEKSPQIKIVGVDPMGSLYYDYFKTGHMGHATPYKVEGIGEDFLPSTMNLQAIDEIMRVTDKECFVTGRALVRQEGILAGGSAGAAVAGAIKYAEAHPGPLRMVVHLPDSATRYLSKYLDDDWMREHGYADAEASLGSVRDMLAAQGNRKLVTAAPQDPIRQIVARMKSHGISQLPVLDGHRLVGVVTEKNLLQGLLKNDVKLDSPVHKVVESAFSSVDEDTATTTVSGLFNDSAVVVVLRNQEMVGLLTKIDLIDYMADKLPL
jgi:cystathionine beta-synthase